jgi:hypothetical protein
MEKLEKDKVYKIKHDCNGYDFSRDYIICSPVEDVDITNLDLACTMGGHIHKWKRFGCHFIVCFDGGLEYKGTSGFIDDCSFLPLNQKDFDEIRKAVKVIGAKYNRKLNKLISTNVEKGASI